MMLSAPLKHIASIIHQHHRINKSHVKKSSISLWTHTRPTEPEPAASGPNVTLHKHLKHETACGSVL